jgi:hypothetical protein
LYDVPNWREGTGGVVDGHMFQHVRCRLKGRLTNRVHADRVPAVTTYHKSAAHNTSGRCVHVLRLLFNGCLRWAFACKQDSRPRPFRVWWLATTLVPGTSGSPIFFDPLFPPNADMTAGEPRGMIIGLQSLSMGGADLAGMTPAKYIIDVISDSVGADADLGFGLPSK